MKVMNGVQTRSEFTCNSMARSSDSGSFLCAMDSVKPSVHASSTSAGAMMQRMNGLHFAILVACVAMNRISDTMVAGPLISAIEMSARCA